MSAPTANFPIESPDDGLLASIIGASERMHDELDVARLWHRIVDEAADLITATTAVVRWRGYAWEVLACSPAAGAIIVRDVGEASAVSGALSRTPAGSASDVSPEVGAPPSPVFDAHWHSVLAAELDCEPNRQPTRLVWLSKKPAAFDAQVGVAALFSRHAGQAVRNVSASQRLRAALDAHRGVGQAHGTLTARYGLTVTEAFTLLRQQSRESEGELRDITAQISATEDLDPDHHHAEDRAMITMSTVDHRADPDHGLKPELIDAVTDALFQAPGPQGRADVLCALMAEVYESIAWLRDTGQRGELEDLRRVLRAADEHREHMINSGAGTEEPRS